MIGDISPVGSRKRLYNMKFSLTTIQTMEGRYFYQRPEPRGSTWILPSLWKQLRVHNYMQNPENHRIILCISPRTHFDFAKWPPCQAVDKKKIWTFRHMETLPNSFQAKYNIRPLRPQIWDSIWYFVVLHSLLPQFQSQIRYEMWGSHVLLVPWYFSSHENFNSSLYLGLDDIFLTPSNSFKNIDTIIVRFLSGIWH